MGAPEAIQAAMDGDYNAFKAETTSMIDAAAAPEFQKIQDSAVASMASALVSRPKGEG